MKSKDKYAAQEPQVTSEADWLPFSLTSSQLVAPLLTSLHLSVVEPAVNGQ